MIVYWFFTLFKILYLFNRRNFMTSSLLWTSATFEPPRVHRGRNRHIVIISKLIESSYLLVLYLLFTIDFSAKFKFEKKSYLFTGLEALTKVPGREGRTGIKIEYCLPRWNSILSPRNNLCEHQLRLIFRNHYMAVGIIVK